MGKYFVPILDPTQVYVPSEYFEAHGHRVSFLMKESVVEADKIIEVGEKTIAAWQATFSIDNSSHAGIITVTTHRLLCCSCVAGNLIYASVPFSPDVECKPVTGFLQKKMPIACRGISVTVQATAEHIAQIRTALEKGIETVPSQEPIAFEPFVFRQGSTKRQEVQRIKSANIDGRRLSKAEATAYGVCPTCKGRVLVERKGSVYCANCNHKLTKNT